MLLRGRAFASAILLAACHTAPTATSNAPAASAASAAPTSEPAVVPSASSAQLENEGAVPHWSIGEMRAYTVSLSSFAHVQESPLTQFTLSGTLKVIALE